MIAATIFLNANLALRTVLQVLRHAYNNWYIDTLIAPLAQYPYKFYASVLQIYLNKWAHSTYIILNIYLEVEVPFRILFSFLSQSEKLYFNKSDKDALSHRLASRPKQMRLYLSYRIDRQQDIRLCAFLYKCLA